ncbi:MAG TPA: hypothetical protein VGY48_15110 [Vicinamibacterales bacterium]|jgi:hypothetical protein|nr:hypothetical protein [Vicinamibacterales bacterium]
MSAGAGNPFGFGSLPVPGVGPARSTPAWQPTPNNAPEGSLTGAPVRTILKSVPLVVGALTVIAPGTRENRVLFITPPDVGFTVYVGDANVSPLTGCALPGGVTSEIPLVGFQEVYAVTDAPVLMRVQVMITSILAAETERRY